MANPLALSRCTASATLLVLSACGGSRARQTTPSPVIGQMDMRIPALLARYQVASVGVALIEHGRVTVAKVYGEQSAGVPASSGTLFNLASLTKPVVAEVLLRMSGKGLFSLDDPMAPDWVDPDVAGDPRHLKLTPRLSLAHQTGLPNWRGRSPGGKLAFLFEPGTAFGYSGEGFDYAARFAERRLGKSFEALAQTYVFDPLRMSSTSFSKRSWMQGRVAVPMDSGRWAEPQVQDSGDWNAGNNLITTVAEYAAFVAAVMRGDALPPSLAAERLRAAAGPQPAPRTCTLTPPAACPRAVAMGLGWLRLDFEDGPVLLFTGWNQRPGGEQTITYFDPQRRRGIVVLTSGTNGRQLYFDILDLVDPNSPVTAFLRGQ